MHNIIKRTLSSLILLAVIATAAAQHPTKNIAFKNGERVSYVLKFNWGMIWATVGTAEWNVAQGTYNGQNVHKVSLRTSTNKRADKYFVMRDTMTTWVTPQLVPLYFEKHGREGKRYQQEWVKYAYDRGKCSISSCRRVNDKEPRTNSYVSTNHAYDMVSMMLRARSMDPTGWTVGHREDFILAEGKQCTRESIIYRGKQTISLDDIKAECRCLVFSFMERKSGKEVELIKFYISDDDNHLPVRLDMNLSFGSAKAFMTQASGLRHPQTAMKEKRK